MSLGVILLLGALAACVGLGVTLAVQVWWLNRPMPSFTQAPVPPRAGDLVLVHRTALPSRLIAFGQHLRFRGSRRRFAHWSHAAIVVSDDGQLAEALAHGIELTHIERYRDVEYVVVPICCDEAGRDRVIRFAMHSVGRRYGYAEIVCLGLYLLTGSKLRFGLNNQLICSAFAAEALSRTDAIFPEEPLWCMPAHLAEYYRVGA